MVLQARAIKWIYKIMNTYLAVKGFSTQKGVKKVNFDIISKMLKGLCTTHWRQNTAQNNK